MKKNKYIRGGLILTFASFLGGFLNYLFNSLSGKLLGPVGYGEITALFSYLAIFSLPVAVVTTDVIRQLGSKGKKQLEFFKNKEKWFWKKIYHWRFLFIPYFLIGLILPKIINLSLLFSITLFVLIFLSLIGAVYSSSLQALHFFTAFSVISIITVTIKLLGPILIYFHVDGINTIAIFLLLSSLAGIILSKYFINKITKKTIIQTKPSNKRILPVVFNQRILITAISLFSLNLINNFDVVFAKKFLTADLAGIYGAWNLFSKIIFYVLGPFLSLGYIFFSSSEEKKYHKKFLYLSAFALLVGGFVFFQVYKYFGNILLYLIFNKNYAVIIQYLPLAAISGIAYSLVTLFNNAYLAKNSKLSLISSFFIIIYIIILLISDKTLLNIIMINVIFSVLTALSYLFMSFIKKT